MYRMEKSFRQNNSFTNSEQYTDSYAPPAKLMRGGTFGGGGGYYNSVDYQNVNCSNYRTNFGSRNRRNFYSRYNDHSNQNQVSYTVSASGSTERNTNNFSGMKNSYIKNKTTYFRSFFLMTSLYKDIFLLII